MVHMIFLISNSLKIWISIIFYYIVLLNRYIEEYYRVENRKTKESKEQKKLRLLEDLFS